MGSKVASKEHFKIRTSGRKRGGRVSCAEEMGSFFSCLSKATGNANVTTVCAAEIANLRNCAASVVRQCAGPGGMLRSATSRREGSAAPFFGPGSSLVWLVVFSASTCSLAHPFPCITEQAKQPKTVNTINYHLQRISRLMR